ncbi:N-acetyl-D-Glu racemase DgcA [Polycladidibacter stylochi]|uniref:N-acetyl-D-Glu racemase DgcA n=1 Tax=Polycladidibacter stylochi TaxID=1807766 RepID=UPI000830F240|nr:N-acetyl-D-Glu racemase DgcA [Pseudovibrio stylochi]
MTVKLSVFAEDFAINGSFTISRGTKTHAQTVRVQLEKQTSTTTSIYAQGECIPYSRYDESFESTIDLIKQHQQIIEAGITPLELLDAMPAGAARNAIDCALWDLAAKTNSKPVHQLLSLPAPTPVETAFTISVGTPEKMAQDAQQASSRPLLKVKLAGTGDKERLQAVRKAAPHSKLIIDANEAWTPQTLEENIAICEQFGVSLIEQPLPAGNDAALATIKTSILICADESLHTANDLEALQDRYTAVNIKLDKTGGLTEALALAQKARKLNFKIMTGCMLGTSLAMAPAILIAQQSDFVDLDGPLLLKEDRKPALVYKGSLLYPAPTSLWG